MKTRIQQAFFVTFKTIQIYFDVESLLSLQRTYLAELETSRSKEQWFENFS